MVKARVRRSKAGEVENIYNENGKLGRKGARGIEGNKRGNNKVGQTRLVKTREGGMITRRGKFNVGRNRTMVTDGDRLTLRGSPEGDRRESEWLKEPGTRGDGGESTDSASLGQPICKDVRVLGEFEGGECSTPRGEERRGDQR